MKSIVSFPALLDKISTLKDGSVKVSFETREFNPEDSAILFSLRNKEGYLLFANHVITDNDIPADPAQRTSTQKSPSQRLRAVLYVYWQQNVGKGNFDDYYKTAMEKYINLVKEKIS